jgi:hypothetical protein
MGQVECNRPRHGAILITGRNERKWCKYLELVSKPRQDSKSCVKLSHLHMLLLALATSSRHGTVLCICYLQRHHRAGWCSGNAPVFTVRYVLHVVRVTFGLPATPVDFYRAFATAFQQNNILIVHLAPSNPYLLVNSDKEAVYV